MERATPPTRRSDWWPSSLSARRWRTWRTASPPTGRFRPRYALARLIVTPLYRALWRVHVEGGEQLPRRGSAILAANHVSSRFPHFW
jgi:1-acyl-sn-glycerol-3-phosphate acyltransferase